MSFVAQVLAILGILGVGTETLEGYTITDQSLSVRIEHILRCSAMSVIGVVIAMFLGGPILQIAYELFWR